MKKRAFLIFLTGLLISCTPVTDKLGGVYVNDYSYQNNTNLPPASIPDFTDNLKMLATAIGERPIKSSGEAKAKEYLLTTFASYGYNKQEGTLSEQDFSSGTNIIARRLTSKKSAKKIVCVTAPYDTVVGSPGAKANASGVAAMLELARLFSLVKVFEDTEIRFIAFAAKEAGFLGSYHYVNTLSENERARVIAVYNIDVFASNRGDADATLVCNTLGERIATGYIQGSMTDPADNLVSQSLGAAATFSSTINNPWIPRHFGDGDHVPFDIVAIDSATVSIRGNKIIQGRLPEEYHSADDIVMVFDYDLIEKSLTILFAAINSLCK